MALVFVGVGLALMLLGSGAVARGGAALFRRIGISPLVISLLVVSLAMSSPELAVSLQAAVKSQADIALGTIIGSNIVNILLVLGLAAVFRPVPAPPKIVFRDVLFLLAASGALLAAATTGALSRLMGAALLAGLVVYIIVCFLTERGRSIAMASAHALPRIDVQAPPASLNIFLLLLGGAFLVFGARYAIDGALALARDYHLPVLIIGFTVVALGTALPELGTALFASFRGNNPLLSGQLLGSSIFNILFVLGLTAIIHPLAISPALSHADVYVMGAAALVLIPMMLSSWRVSRFEGFMLIAGYAAWLGFLAWRMNMLPFAG